MSGSCSSFSTTTDQCSYNTDSNNNKNNNNNNNKMNDDGKF